MFHLSLEQGYSILVLVGVAAGTIGATAWLYHRIYADLSRGRWWFLFGLRAGALLLVLFLLFRPILSLEKEAHEERGLIFLVDASASMASTDDPSKLMRLDLVRAKLAEWWPRLKQDFDLHLLEFSDRAGPLGGLDDLAQVKPAGQATSLTRALQAGAQRLPRQSIEALVLISDGIHNAAGNPLQTARQLGVPIHTIGVGSSLRNNPSYRDVQVASLDCPAQLVLNNQAKITATIESVGFNGRVLKPLLEEDGKVVAESDLVLNSSSGPQEVSFQFLPGKRGRRTYTVRLPSFPEEYIQQNNQRSGLSQVTEVRIQVLYLEGALRAEYGALVERFFSKDPDIEFCALVQTKRNVFVQRSNMKGIQLTGIPSDPAILQKFNVFVVGDLDSSYFKGGRMELLAKRVQEGAGLVMLGGYNTLGPGGFGGTALEGILPVVLGERNVGQISEPFLPQLTPEGRNHLILANIGKFFPTKNGGPEVAGLPLLRGCVKVAGTRPGASVLAIHPDGTPQGMAVLAVQSAGKGRSAVFTGDTTRNWHQVLRALDQESPFVRFWGQLVRWLANRSETIKGELSVTAQTDKAYYEPDSTIAITALVRDKEGEGSSKAQVQARIKTPQGKEEMVTLALSARSAGQYEAQFEPKAAGPYEISVVARVGGASPAAEKITVEVGRPNLEYDRLDLDDRLLSQIAEAAGGSYHHLSTADRLVEAFQRKEEKRRVHMEQPLYWPGIYWVLFVFLLVNEWALRKRYRLR